MTDAETIELVRSVLDRWKQAGIATPAEMIAELDDALQQQSTAGSTLLARVRCDKCHRVWIVSQLPQPATIFARQLKRATCPSCGETRKLSLLQTPPPRSLTLDDTTGGAQ